MKRKSIDERRVYGPGQSLGIHPQPGSMKQTTIQQRKMRSGQIGKGESKKEKNRKILKNEVSTQRKLPTVANITKKQSTNIEKKLYDVATKKSLITLERKEPIHRASQLLLV